MPNSYCRLTLRFPAIKGLYFCLTYLEGRTQRSSPSTQSCSPCPADLRKNSNIFLKVDKSIICIPVQTTGATSIPYNSLSTVHQSSRSRVRIIRQPPGSGSGSVNLNYGCSESLIFYQRLKELRKNIQYLDFYIFY